MLLFVTIILMVLITTMTSIGGVIDTSKEQINTETTVQAVENAEASLELLGTNMDNMLQTVSARLETLKDNEIIKNSVEDRELIDIFKKTQGLDAKMQSVYMGTQGKEMKTYPPADLPSDYNPHNTEWYMGATGDSDKVYWSPPYVDSNMGNLVITAAQEIKNNQGQRQGVLAVDVSLESIQGLMREFLTYEESNMLIVDNKGIIMHNNEYPEKVGIEVKDDNLRTMITDKGAKERHIEFADDGVPRIATIYKMEKYGISFVEVIPKEVIESFGTTMTKELETSVSSSLLKIGFTALIILVVVMIIVYLMISKIITPIITLSEFSKKIGEGDLREDVDMRQDDDEVGILGQRFNDMKNEIKDTVYRLQTASGEINAGVGEVTEKYTNLLTSSEEIMGAVEEIASGSETQANDLDAGNHKMHELVGDIEELVRNNTEVTNSVTEISSSTDENKKMLELKTESEDSIEEMKETTQIVKEFITNIEGISRILGDIRNISSQTNLLALNATIEATRAGDVGRGFAVVAGEIGKLSGQTEELTNSIAETISLVTGGAEKTEEAIGGISGTFNRNLKNVDEANTIFDKVQAQIDEITERVQNNNSHMGRVTEKVGEVQRYIQDVAAVSQEVAASTEEVTATMVNQVDYITNTVEIVDNLRVVSDGLAEITKRYKI